MSHSPDRRSFELNEMGTGTLTITYFEEGERIAGSFVALDGELTCSFDVSFSELAYY